MSNLHSGRYLPKARVYGSIVKKYFLKEDIDPSKEYDPHKMLDFKVGFLFGVVHLN